ncbi:Putative HrgA like protein [Helicobacter heilmannii]|uniref:hypothetical protein n=1 Tax=Helicobacter heilmannii TaxID=35817 RepID=UPI00244D8CF0|nr:hypothetical protein [Helicobacter heilmannii]GMB94939.1 Putative HrgA like protein [Helicobacter heilmannii]
MKQEYIDIVLEVLEVIQEPINPSHIYAKAQELYKAGKISKTFAYTSKTPNLSCSAAIYTAIAKTPDKLPFIRVRDKPLLITLKDKPKLPLEQIPKETNGVHPKQTAFKEPPKEQIKERDLHPLLTYIAHHQWGIYTKTIHHEKSTKNTKGLDQWIYPDMVGVSFTYQDFKSPNVRNFIKKFDTLPVKLVSFELKRKLMVGNCREAYFQAISNSSWAHVGYLVAGKLDRDNQELMDLLKQLNQSFGIGVITLDIQSPTQNAILLNAKEKENLDYPTLAKLATRNPNFESFLKSVTDYDIDNPERYQKEFDPLPSNFPTLH